MKYCISDKFRLHRQEGMLIFKDHLDRSILELPETKMLAVARNQFEDTLKNNHYHGVVQQTEEMIDGCEITHISACDGGVEITGKIRDSAGTASLYNESGGPGWFGSVCGSAWKRKSITASFSGWRQDPKNTFMVLVSSSLILI